MLLVIFGAGASYDSVSALETERWSRETGRGERRPPLADELFAGTAPFRAIANKYPRCQPLIPELAPRSGLWWFLGFRG